MCTNRSSKNYREENNRKNKVFHQPSLTLLSEWFLILITESCSFLLVHIGYLTKQKLSSIAYLLLIYVTYYIKKFA